MTKRKLLFIDRDGTLIKEPDDQQVDCLSKLALMPDVVVSLLQLKKAGYVFIMVSNQDGLGTESFPYHNFSVVQDMLLMILKSQGIEFENVCICPHFLTDGCECRKPKVGLLLDYLRNQKMDREHSFVIGDRETDLQLAEAMGIKGIQIGTNNFLTWPAVVTNILTAERKATVARKTNETDILINVNLDKPGEIQITTGINFFDHMLEQLAKQGGFSLSATVKGDLQIDDHHTVEDTAIALGEALQQALNDKWGIARYGFVLPMDESIASIALDLSGRAYCVFQGKFPREKVGELSTELVPHFFRSLADSLKASLHISVQGENTHHMVEAIFKGVGRTLRQAIQKIDDDLPSTKGVL